MDPTLLFKRSFTKQKTPKIEQLLACASISDIKNLKLTTDSHENYIYYYSTMTPSLLDCVLMEEDSSAPNILLKVLNNIKHTKTLECLNNITVDSDSESVANITEDSS